MRSPSTAATWRNDEEEHVMATPEQVVLDFLATWESGDIDELMSFFAPDAVYHNIPVPPVRGADAIRAAFLGFAQLMQSISIDNLHVAANGGVVFTERIDRFRSAEVALDLPVAGVFEVRDGKIVAHRDYFDYRTWLDATGIPLG
jgi:limonene-1,2-epoxide hydrolase